MYFCALYRMCKDSTVPRDWIGHLREHQEQLATMALDWEWDLCLLWSERVFSMIDDGRLPGGLDDNNAIKDIEWDACAVGTWLYAKKNGNDYYNRCQDENGSGDNQRRHARRQTVPPVELGHALGSTQYQKSS